MATMTLTELREFLQTTLREALEIPFVGGYVDGPTSRDMGCVVIDSTKPAADSFYDEDIAFSVRVFQQLHDTQNPEKPADPKGLEAFDRSVKAALAEKQTIPGYDDPWFFTVESSSFNYDEWCVDFEIVVQGENPFGQ
jgi:hypothetical protein